MWIYKELEKRLCRCLYILFLTAASFADFCIFSVPPPSLSIVSVSLNWRHVRWLSATYICRFYILRRKVDSAWDNASLGTSMPVSASGSVFTCFVPRGCSTPRKSYPRTLQVHILMHSLALSILPIGTIFFLKTTPHA